MKFKDHNIDSLSTKQKEVRLNKFRKKVDFIDRILVYLLNRRTKLTVMIGRIKLSLSLPTYSPERERDVMEKAFKHNNGPLSEDSLERIYERILDESRATQKSESPKLFPKSDASEK